MALVAETLVEEWLNRKGYFTIRGAKAGQGEIDLLAVSFREPDALHVEVSVSARAIGYVSGPPIAKKPPEELKASVDEWCARKFRGRKDQVSRRREELCPGRDWRFMLVYGDLKHSEELLLIEEQGVEVRHIRDVLDELWNLADTRTSSEASGVAELLEICREEQGKGPAKVLEASEGENAENFSLVEGGRLKPWMLVLDIRGNAKNGSVPEGDGVVEVITNITRAAPGSHGQEYVKLHLEAVEGGATRTKYLSKAKKVMAKAGGRYEGGKGQPRIEPAGDTADGEPSLPANEGGSGCDVHTLLRLPTNIFYAQGVKANVLFFDKMHGREEAWTKELWIYDLRTNTKLTRKKDPLSRQLLDEFVELYNPDNRYDRQPTWSEALSQGRWRNYSYEDIVRSEGANLDLSWIVDNSLDDSADLEDPDVIAEEIVDDLEAALGQFSVIVKQLRERGITG